MLWIATSARYLEESLLFLKKRIPTIVVRITSTTWISYITLTPVAAGFGFLVSAEVSEANLDMSTV